MAHIYIVEDDVNIREIEAFSLKNSGYTVEEFGSAKEFWSRIYEKVPDLIVLDVMLPDEDGLSIVKKLRQWAESRYVPIIMVTTKTTELDRVKGLDRGADDYLTKPFGVMELISRVKALLRRSMQNHEIKQMKVGEIELNDEKRQVKVSGEPITLTYKEYELLKMLMSNTGIVLQRGYYGAYLGHGLRGESRTLDMHIKTLRHKLGDAGKKIRTVRNVGYQLEE